MACVCVEPDGSKSSQCYGCNIDRIINPEQKVRYQGDKFSIEQLNQIKELLHEFKVPFALEAAWVLGFERGFLLGREIYEE